MLLLAKILFNKTNRFCWRFRYFLYFFTGVLAVSFVYFETEKRILSLPRKGETSPAQIPSIIENVEKTDSLVVISKSIPKTPIPPVHSVKKKKSKEDRERAFRVLKESSQDPAFVAFSDWLEEFERFACTEPVNCGDHDPRYTRNLLVRGESLARARHNKFLKLITTNPKQAIELAIPEGISQKLPLNISRHLEKWQNGLIDVKSWHACKSQTHLLCKINQQAIFENGKIFELFSYGNRKHLPTLKGLSAWGISLGDKFAMSEQAIYSPSNSGDSGKLIFAGKELSYSSKIEKNYFEEIVNQAEGKNRRFRGKRKINYPISMGSDGTVRDYLREKYEIFFFPEEFTTIPIPNISYDTYPETPAPIPHSSALSDLHYAGYTDRPGKKLLQIESQAENDYIVELLNRHFVDASSDFIWLGATKDQSQTTFVYDRKNQQFRTVLLSSWGATGNNWFWRDGSSVIYSNWGPSPGVDKYAVLNWRTGMWETKVDSEKLPYILEKELPFEIGSVPANLSGTRKILVVPARFEDQTTKMRSATDSYSGWRLERNHLLTNEFGELINEDVYTEPFEPISRTNLEELMQEVKDFYLRNTDQQLNLIPVFVPTVTIPWRINEINTIGTGEHNADTSGEETGEPDKIIYDKGNPVLDFAEYAMIEAGKESEEWDFYGPAFVGVADIKLTAPLGNYSASNLPLITLEGGAYINTSTLLPHPRFKSAELEPILNEDGNLTSIRVVDPGAYYFDPEFGSQWDSGRRSIFDYNYTTDDNEPDPNSRSALHEYRDLCQKLDQNSDGIADYNTTSRVEPTLLLDGVPLSHSEYSLEINNVCLTWVGLTNYEQEEEGLAWYGAPGAHVIVREGQASSRTVAHEIGHNFGLMHAQRYATKGEQALSDEGIKEAIGNSYSVMGSAPSISNGMGDLTIAAKLFFFDLYDGQAGYTPGLQKGVDILDINSASDLTNTNLSEIDPVGIPNKFRIYRSNSSVPPLALREANFSLNMPNDILNMLNEYFGEANYSNSPNIPSSAHDFNQTASDLNKSIKLVAVGSGQDVVANLLFNQTANPILEIVNGGRGFVKEPRFKILKEDNKTEFLNINPAWIRELSPLDHLQGQLFDSNLTNRWIRGARISAGSSVTKPIGLDVSQPLNNYFLSYRSDISTTGLVLMASNNPDINNSYVIDRENFYTRNEAFLLDATPQTPNDDHDFTLSIGTTYSDHGADIHITPTAFGGGQDFEAIKLKIDEKRELVLGLRNSNLELRETVKTRDTNVATIASDIANARVQVEQQELLVAGYIELNLVGTELHTEAVEQLAYLQALLTLSEAAQEGADTQLEASFLLLEENDFQLNLELNNLNELSNSYQIEQDDLFPYIEFVVNIGTIADGSAQAPSFELLTTSQTPAVGDSINIRAMVTDGNTSSYAYSWFVNEKPFNAPNQLNSPVISTKFSEPGHNVIRAIVSDMKGGIVSRNLIISVGEAEKKNKSLVTGTVRSTDGFLQGARVVINESPVIEHNLSMSGNLRDSFYPSGELDPASFSVDGQLAPELTFRRGEIHRFYFDKSLQDYNISFLEKPENNPPRFEINMLTDPRVNSSGSAYFRNPDVNYTTRSAFSSYLSDKTGTYLEMLEYLQDRNNSGIDLNETNSVASKNPQFLDLLEYAGTAGITRFSDINGTRKANQIMNPYPKAILSETSVTKGIVGPTFANELGYITFGGRGYDRNDTPRVDVRRSSIWEDYFNSSNASAVVRVDGVGTISPVNAVDPGNIQVEFLGNSWALRTESSQRQVTVPDSKDDPTLTVGANTDLPPVPDLVVWGTGGGDDDDPLSEVNARVSAWKTTVGTNVRTIEILNQGKGFEPDGTMAVLHYPRDPFAYWSFDRHESLFEDKNESRHQPSPAWNRELAGLGDRLKHYWSLDEEINSTTTSLSNEKNSSAILNIKAPTTFTPLSTWGLLGKAIRFDGTRDLNASGVIPDGNFTLSFWVNLTSNTDLNLTIAGLPLDYNETTKEADFGPGLTLEREDVFNSWMHLAVTYDGNVSLYVDGRKKNAFFTFSDRNLEFEGLSGLLDEIKIYDIALSEPQVRYLSGRNYLDLSGNKYHATPVGVNFLPVSPETTADVPNEFSLPNTPVIGTRIMNLGDSYPSEDHGRSLLFDGLDDHLDMSSHLLEFGIPEGTFSLWLKTSTSNTSPLFWLSSPLEVTLIEIEETNSTEPLITPGSFFAMELVNGIPRLGGVTAFDQSSKVNDGEWHHVVASFPNGIIWIDGNRVPTESYNTDDILFTGAQNLLEFIADADELYIGKAPDRTQPNVTSTFNGRLDDVIIYDRTLTNHEVTYLYELRRGREQIPRLEAVVDAIGTVEINEGGSGYRENPDLVFWYGANNETKQDLTLIVSEFKDLNASQHGTLAYVATEDQVYSFHEGNTSTYPWRLNDVNTGWRPHTAASGIGEFGSPEDLTPNVEDIVWTKKLDFVTQIPLPDGRWDKRLYVDYITMDGDLNSTSPINDQSTHYYNYSKPNGLGGFVERPNFKVAYPLVHNPDARPDYQASVYGLFFIDHDQNDSLTIVDGGSGFDVPGVGFDLTFGYGEPFSVLQFKVHGKGFQPRQAVSFSQTYSNEGLGEFYELEEEYYPNFAEFFPYTMSDHTSNEPSEIFNGPNWTAVVTGLNDSVTTKEINVGGDPTEAYPITEVTIDANQTDLNKTIGSVSIDAAGFGYARPIELRVVGGRPIFDERVGQVLPAIQQYQQTLGVASIEVTANNDAFPNPIPRGRYIYKDAEFNVTKIDSNGSILKGIFRKAGPNSGGVEILNGGLGYIPFNILPKTDPYAQTNFILTSTGTGKEKWSGAPNPPIDFHLNEYPFVSVSGGGGYGAQIRINEIDINTGEIIEIEVVNGGRGYFNIDPQNFPKVVFPTSVNAPHRDANLSVRLGGSLKEIPPCTGCSDGTHINTYSHLEPWIEIWDRGRSESEIDEARAHAAPKVVDGKITKVVVINSGSGYIDPVAIVRGVPPKHSSYKAPGGYERIWRCTFTRVAKDGQEKECGHIAHSLYPPDYCPGETDDNIPYEDENGTLIIAKGNQITAWIGGHSINCKAFGENTDHINANFVSRKCWGTKINYELTNPFYRIDGDPDENQTWAPLDAKLSVVSEGGRILKIEVMKEGQDYFSSKLVVEGSGSGVDAIPVFNEFGINTHVIFDDPRLTNDELDKFNFRSGRGQGFRERPWSWDDSYESVFGGREKVKVYAWHSEVITTGGLTHTAWDWNFGDPILNDNLGDQVVAIDIIEPGLYASDFNGSGAPDLDVPTIEIDFNTTVNFHDINGNPIGTVDMNLSDHDGNGYSDFAAARASMHGTYTITHTLLNHDSIITGLIDLGLFSENPVLEYYDRRNLSGFIESPTDYVDEQGSDYIRLNRQVSYDPEKDLSYIELYVDDRFPNQLYYGLDLTNGQESRVLPRFGNVITVTESLPGMNWASNEPGEKKKYSYTDANGFYALPNLNPGFYNIAVFMEDQKLQEMTFRPDSNISRVSQPLYLSGFPQIKLETDQYGPGRSSLVWSPEARRLSRPATDMNFREEYDQEYRVLKRLDGMGRGFDPASPPPELTIIPDPNNISITPPNIEVKVLVDGSLQLRIIDDENTSKYFPLDVFYVFHNSQINDIDFVETYLYSESNQTFSFGTKADATPGLGKFLLFPNDGNGTNPISVPVSTYEREWNSTTLSWAYLFRERPFQLSTIAYDENGSSVDTSTVQWSVHLEFNNSLETNNSRIVLLEDSNGHRGQDATGSQVNAYLFSLLRKGRVEDLEIINGGKNYSLGSLIRLSGQGEGFLAFVDDVNASTGSIKSIKILSHGEKYSHTAIPHVVDIEGSSAILKPILPYTGTVKIEANITLPGTSSVTTKSILLKPSLKYPLDSLETWRNRYTDSFWSDASDPNWKQNSYLSLDIDGDSLSNAVEWSKNTNPLKHDTDDDGLDDDLEIGTHSTNPLLPDTDGDGLPDSNETFGSISDPLKYDTDKDGISDLEDIDPRNPDGNGIIAGVVVKKTIYDLNATVYFHCGPYAPFPTLWDSNWTKKMNNFYLTGKTPGNYTLRSFIDFQPQNGTYDPGEPYAESNLTLTSLDLEEMGKYLVPTDPPPEIQFFDVPSENGYAVNSANLMERNVTIDVNETNSISSFAYAVEASDPYDNIIYRDVNASFILENGLNKPVEFLVDGNFTQYMDLNPSRADFNSSVKFDLNSTPIGNYYLTFRAVDHYGNISPAIRQNIEIKDTQPPYISLLDLDNAKGITTFSKTELQTVIPEVNFDLNETNNSVVWKWPFGQPFKLEDLSVVQSNEGVIIVHVMDTKNEFLTNWSVDYEYNDTTVDPAFTREDIDNLNLTFLISDANNTDRIGLHKLKFNATDRSGNQLDFTLYLLINPAYQSTITAVDGYLENARVGFDADGDGISDLNREFYTNIYGRADVLFTAAEFANFDINGNGKLDPQEGKFIVTGGFDTSTGSVFSGKLYADANSTVVSPLTTLISQLMENGLSKKEATARLANALGLSEDLDLTAYDPIQKAFEGDANATFVMLANLRMANLMNQSEGLLRALSEEYEGYKIGTDILDEVANWISSKGNLELLDLENALVDAIPMALAQAGTAGELSLDDQLAMFQLMTDFDSEFLKIDEDLGFEELMTKQITFIEELEDLVTDLTDKLPTPKKHILELNFTDGGVVYGAGDYRYGSKAAIMAVPNNHYKFIKWNGDGLQDVNVASTVVLMTEDRNITALFEQIYYDVAVLSSIGGSVEGAGQYLSGEQASILATPQEGYKFSHWSGYYLPDPAVPLIDIDVDKSFYITAEFERVPRSLNVQASTGGHVHGSGDYRYGDNVSISAVPDLGYVFSHWTGGSIQDSYAPSTYINVTEDQSLTAKFELAQPGNLTLSVVSFPEYGGYSTGPGNHAKGSPITLTAHSFSGYEFDRWTNEEDNFISNDFSISYTLDIPTTLHAHFKPQYHMLEVEIYGQGEANESGAYMHGENVVISATPETGYLFDRWVGENITNPHLPETTVFIDKSVRITAVFEPIEFKLAISSNHGGLATGGGSYSLGDIATLAAFPATGYKFSGWSEAGLGERTAERILVEMNASREIYAKFELINNFFTPQGQDFYHHLNIHDLAADLSLLTLLATDGDGTAVTFDLISGNMDLDGDGVGIFKLLSNGKLFLEDMDEVKLSASKKLTLIVSISDNGGKTNQLKGIVEIPNLLILESSSLGNLWYDSPWFGKFFWEGASWLYHNPLGWMYIHPASNDSFWLWHQNLKSWLWTNKDLFPQAYSGTELKWLYFHLDSQNVRIFDYDHQSWDVLR